MKLKETCIKIFIVMGKKMQYLKKLIAAHFTQDYRDRQNIIDCKHTQKTIYVFQKRISNQTAANIGLHQVAGQIYGKV